MADEQDYDSEWDAAWLDELDRRAQTIGAESGQVEDWQVVRERLLAMLLPRT